MSLNIPGKVPINTLNDSGNNALFIAIDSLQKETKKAVKFVKVLLQLGLDPNTYAFHDKVC